MLSQRKEQCKVFVLLMFFSFSVVSVSVELVMVFEKVEFNIVYFRREVELSF